MMLEKIQLGETLPHVMEHVYLAKRNHWNCTSTLWVLLTSFLP